MYVGVQLGAYVFECMDRCVCVCGMSELIQRTLKVSGVEGLGVERWERTPPTRCTVGHLEHKHGKDINSRKASCAWHRSVMQE